MGLPRHGRNSIIGGRGLLRLSSSLSPVLVFTFLSFGVTVNRQPGYRQANGSSETLVVSALFCSWLLCTCSLYPSVLLSFGLCFLARVTLALTEPVLQSQISGGTWLGSPLNSGLPNLVPPECVVPRYHALLLIVPEAAWYKDPSGAKHGSKLICFAGYHSADSKVSGSKCIKVDPSTDQSSYALLAITRQTPWYQDPS